MEEVLRPAWNSRKYLKGDSTGDDQPFLVEDESRAHVQRLNNLMQTTSDWCAIRLVTYLSQAADFLGQWGESCPCEHHNDGPQLVKKLSGQRVRVGRQSEGSTCPFRCCRAAELASGKALTLLTALVESQQSKFLKCVATAPVAHQSALTGAWYTATSKLLGSLFQLQIHIA